MKQLLTIFLLVFIFNTTFGLKKVYRTSKIAVQSPILDGNIEEPAWKSVKWGLNFLQQSPFEGEHASNKTYFKITYDANNLYVAIRAFDNDPEKIALFNSTRDNLKGDYVEINIDSYYDQRTAFAFSANVAGVKGDRIIFNDGNNSDDSWNPVWYLATAIDDKGWTAEMQIPFDQLRFSKNKEQKWGVQVLRNLYRGEELSCWQFIPQEATGWVHNFGVIYGIENITTDKTFEFLPYTLAAVETDKKVDGNPFQKGFAKGFDIGLDGKMKISNNVIMDITINPNFRQVEPDPTIINLSGLETYYDEKRPFFIEGKNIMEYSISPAYPHLSKDNLFYSRRIGRKPQYNPSAGENENIDVPENTSIIGAAKLTGKTNNGLSFGIIESVTSRERAEVDYLGDRDFITVEPTTNYFVGRVQKDINKGRTIVGGIVTSTIRNINTSDLSFLHKNAFTGGADIKYYITEDKKYYVGGNAIFSVVNGSTEAIIRTQRSSSRYYQRPDADYVSVDSTLTSLSGYGGDFVIGKNGGSKFSYSLEMTWRSPGLEMNDLGYLRQADQFVEKLAFGYSQNSATNVFNKFNAGFWQYKGWDFGGNHIFERYALQASFQFKNFYGSSAKIERYGEAYSNNILRGGPAMIVPGKWVFTLYSYSSTKNKLSVSGRGVLTSGDKDYYNSFKFGMGVGYRHTEKMNFSVGAGYTTLNNNLQYYDHKTYNLDDRYLLASINQKTFDFSVRFDYFITPELSLQFYAKPFISTGKYSNFKSVIDSKADNYNQRIQQFTEGNEINYNQDNNNYEIDENGDMVTDYTLSNKNFNITDFNLNFILSWEYQPGSQLYFVWTQNRYNKAMLDYNDRIAGIGDVFNTVSHNVFYIQATYRFTR